LLNTNKSQNIQNHQKVRNFLKKDAIKSEGFDLEVKEINCGVTVCLK